MNYCQSLCRIFYETGYTITNPTPYQDPVWVCHGSPAKFYTTSINCREERCRLEVSHSDELDFRNRDFTLDFWLNYRADSATHAVILSNCGAGNTGNLWIEVDKDTSEAFIPRIRLWNSQDNDYYTSINNPSIAQNTWYHLALTRNGGSFYYFLDGHLEETWEVDPNYELRSHTNGLTIGALHNGYIPNDDYTIFNGNIEELRIKVGEAIWTESFSRTDRTLYRLWRQNHTDVYSNGDSHANDHSYADFIRWDDLRNDPHSCGYISLPGKSGFTISWKRSNITCQLYESNSPVIDPAPT